MQWTWLALVALLPLAGCTGVAAECAAGGAMLARESVDFEGRSAMPMPRGNPVRGEAVVIATDGTLMLVHFEVPDTTHSTPASSPELHGVPQRTACSAVRTAANLTHDAAVRIVAAWQTTLNGTAEQALVQILAEKLRPLAASESAENCADGGVVTVHGAAGSWTHSSGYICSGNEAFRGFEEAYRAWLSGVKKAHGIGI